MSNELKMIEKAADFIRKQVKESPKTALVLGSGLGELASEMENAIEIPYREIPGFPVSTVEGHEGSLIFGRLNGASVAAMKGRVHYYEGFSMAEVVRPVRILRALGVENLLLTNAAGGINKKFSAASLMMINDHIGLFCDNPLRGANIDSFGPRFPDMTEIYTKELKVHIVNAASELKIPLQTGVYAYAKGPSYETPAEIRMLKQLGADAIGMSTVPEAIAAAHCGMKVAGISCITNMAAGLQGRPLNHKEVMESAEAVRGRFKELVKCFVREVNEA